MRAKRSVTHNLKDPANQPEELVQVLNQPSSSDYKRMRAQRALLPGIPHKRVWWIAISPTGIRRFQAFQLTPVRREHLKFKSSRRLRM
jgi:hypothetical protein